MPPSEPESGKLAESILAILLPLREEWEEAPRLIEAVSKGLFSEESLAELANLLVNATESVTENERIANLSLAFEFVQRNREKELAEHQDERSENEALINSL
jgi:hypothetical protein